MIEISPEVWMTTGQAARVLRVSDTRIRQLRLAGKLRYLVTPLGNLLAAEDVLRRASERGQARTAQ